MELFRRVAVGISGGVDSAVTALLLKLRGYDVQGVFMKNWDGVDEVGECTTLEDFEDARYVCSKLDIPLHEVNFVKQYWVEVFQYFMDEYQAGFTPNPDIICNKKIKFDLLLKHVRGALGADALATGHYAANSFGSFLENHNPAAKARLLIPRDTFKDQTFFLSQISQDALKLTMFPLGNYTKMEVKKLAVKHGLGKIAAKKESTGMCFIGRRHFQSFISEYIEAKPGRFVSLETGKVLGTHNGFHQWTLGQGCRLTGFKDAYFVASKDVQTNDIFVVPGSKHPALYTDVLFTGPLYGIAESLAEVEVLPCEFRFQHTKPLTRCILANISFGSGVVLLERPLKAITPGQFGVFYRGNECLGGAKILRPGPSYFSRNQSIDKDYEDYRIQADAAC